MSLNVILSNVDIIAEFCAHINFEVKNCVCTTCSSACLYCLWGKPLRSRELLHLTWAIPKGRNENFGCPVLGCISLFLNKGQLAVVLPQEGASVFCSMWEERLARRCLEGADEETASLVAGQGRSLKQMRECEIGSQQKRNGESPWAGRTHTASSQLLACIGEVKAHGQKLPRPKDREQWSSWR